MRRRSPKSPPLSCLLYNLQTMHQRRLSLKSLLVDPGNRRVFDSVRDSLPFLPLRTSRAPQRLQRLCGHKAPRVSLSRSSRYCVSSASSWRTSSSRCGSRLPLLFLSAWSWPAAWRPERESEGRRLSGTSLWYGVYLRLYYDGADGIIGLAWLRSWRYHVSREPYSIPGGPGSCGQS